MMNQASQQHERMPTPPKLMYRMADLPGILGISRAEIYRKIKAGNFPKGVPLSPQVVVWNPDEIRHWVKKQLVPSDVPPGE
ncbi:MAG: AlpA family phage regulatory protein [Castellaniella sp.]|uniref:helix-turn-helix transcriptional regulator n=1 Tax=Castellaniella sp. TaxID=1955812 RepID=UPI003C715EC0